MRRRLDCRAGARCLVACCGLLVGGCWGGYEFAEVKGTVTMDGKPMAGLMLEFAPERRGDEQPPLAYGFTDTRGVYVARDRRAKPGAIVGLSRVSITTTEGGPPMAPGRMLGETSFDREIKPGSNTLDFELKSRPTSP